MPATALPANPGAVDASPFCPVGEYEQTAAGTGGASPTPVRHIGMASPADWGDPGAGTVSVSAAGLTPICHLSGWRVCVIGRSDFRQVHVIGAVGASYQANLPADQAVLFATEVAALDGEQFVYVAHPPICEVVDPDTGRFMGRRFSCVGFVLWCYRQVGIELLAPFDSPAYPRFDLGHLTRVWPELRNLAGRPGFLTQIGLNPADAPWPVVVPGYVFHALNGGSLPFQPTSPAQTDF